MSKLNAKVKTIYPCKSDDMIKSYIGETSFNKMFYRFGLIRAIASTGAFYWV